MFSISSLTGKRAIKIRNGMDEVPAIKSLGGGDAIISLKTSDFSVRLGILEQENRSKDEVL